MTQPTTSTSFYGDFSTLSALKKDARAENPQALRKAAQQFESLFTEMMLKSMRAASFGDELTGSQEVDFYQGMFDQQLSLQLSKGKGMGLADMLVQQLARSGLSAPPATSELKGSPPAVQSAPDAVPIANATPTSTVQPVVASSNSVKPAGLSAESPADFVRCVWPHAEQAALRLGVDPSMLVAHAALETGWGRHVPNNPDGTSSFNLFGIKASSRWKGDSTNVSTLEYIQGKPVQQQADFKSYSSLSDCFADYAQMIGGQSRYQQALNAGANANQFANGLQRGGYATDPAYSQKLQAAARSVVSMLSKGG